MPQEKTERERKDKRKEKCIDPGKVLNNTTPTLFKN